MVLGLDHQPVTSGCDLQRGVLGSETAPDLEPRGTSVGQTSFVAAMASRQKCWDRSWQRLGQKGDAGIASASRMESGDGFAIAKFNASGKGS